MKSKCIFFLITLLACTSAHAKHSYRTMARFDAPVETFGNPAQLEALRTEIHQSPDQAAKRLDALLRDHANELMSPEEGRLISIAGWIAALSPPDRAALASEYHKQFDAPADAALKTLQQNPTASPEQFYLLARRWPLSAAATPALIEAGDRALRNGDSFAAAAFLELARDAGWKPDERHASILAACHGLNDEPGGILPKESKDPDHPDHPDRPAYRGPIPFDASWYNRNEAVAAAKYFPTASDTAIYLATPRSVLAMRESGQLIWNWSSPQAPSFRLERDRSVGRGPNVNVATFNGVSGAQILVVRQPRLYVGDYALRAFRATDGKLLWSTENGKHVDDIAFISAPSVAGRYVYVMGLSFSQGSPAELSLCALDVLDGRLLWRSSFGTLRDMPRFRDTDRQHGWDSLWEQSEPCVAGDLVCVAPSVGMVMAVDRFDGKLRWLRAYKESKADVDPNRRNGRWDRGEERESIPTNPLQLQRYNNTPRAAGLYGPSPILLSAPQDSAILLGLSLKTGELMFEDPNPPSPTLVAATAEVGILAGTFIHGIDPTTGKVRWLWSPPAPATITGPAVLANQTLYVPTTEKIFGISTTDGKTIQDPKPKPPNFRIITNSDTAKKLMEESTKSFGPPQK